MNGTEALLQVEDLRVTFVVRGRELRAVDGVSYCVYPRQTLAVVGESGSGKTVSCRAVLGLLPGSAEVTGSARFQGIQLIGLTDDQLRAHRGAGVAMVFQDPSRSLNPTMRIGGQIAEAVRAHRRVSKAQAHDQAVELLRLVRMPLPERRCTEYPHQLSGGMRQRVMIAIALASRPKLDPKWIVRDLVAEPLVAYRTGDRAARRQRVDEVLELVGLDPASHGRRRPRELSGGQAQRVAIARAVALSPALIICDEAVSSLDVLIQAQVLNLFERLRTELSLSYLFIAHDLALVKQVSDRVAVMYLGKLCEVGPGETVYREPLHPYTRALLDSVPSTEPRYPGAGPAGAAGQGCRAATTISGEPPSPIHPPSGGRFRTRCPRATELCAAEEPPMRELAAGHTVACHFPLASQSAARTTARSEEIEETPR
jgi:oligopeptide/dipeptide ABC transporter ATP-binding protein